jgi:excisionase family DNA binding protein
MTRLITDSEVGELLRLSSRQVEKLAKRGEIPSIRLPDNEIRFDPDEIRRYIESRKQPATDGGAK